MRHHTRPTLDFSSTRDDRDLILKTTASGFFFWFFSVFITTPGSLLYHIPHPPSPYNLAPIVITNGWTFLYFPPFVHPTPSPYTRAVVVFEVKKNLTKRPGGWGGTPHAIVIYYFPRENFVPNNRPEDVSPKRIKRIRARW